MILVDVQAPRVNSYHLEKGFKSYWSQTIINLIVVAKLLSFISTLIPSFMHLLISKFIGTDNPSSIDTLILMIISMALPRFILKPIDFELVCDEATTINPLNLTIIEPFINWKVHSSFILLNVTLIVCSYQFESIQTIVWHFNLQSRLKWLKSLNIRGFRYFSRFNLQPRLKWLKSLQPQGFSIF